MIRVVVVGVLAAVLVQRDVSEPDLLRGFAFAKCLSEGYRDQDAAFAKDARHVAELYRDAGKTSQPEVYVRLQQMAVATKPATPAAIDHSNLAIMRCLEFYESPYLKKMAKEAR